MGMLKKQLGRALHRTRRTIGFLQTVQTFHYQEFLVHNDFPLFTCLGFRQKNPVSVDKLITSALREKVAGFSFMKVEGLAASCDFEEATCMYLSLSLTAIAFLTGKLSHRRFSSVLPAAMLADTIPLCRTCHFDWPGPDSHPSLLELSQDASRMEGFISTLAHIICQSTELAKMSSGRAEKTSRLHTVSMASLASLMPHTSQRSRP